METTVRQALAASVERLGSTSQHPRRDAELLLMYVLGCDLAILLARPERVLSTTEAAQYRSLLARRGDAEPMQYITGEQEFFGLSLRVTPDVLIPRPETEHLVETLLDHVDRDAAIRIVDVGTGSGAIAIALARTLPQAQLTAIDLSSRALDVARENALRHGVDQRIRFLKSDLLAAIEGENFHVVVSNPPYIAEGEELEAQVRDFEPHAALYAGKSGLEIYERLIPQAFRALRPGGWLMLEIGHGQKHALSRILSGWSETSFVEDLQGIPRVAAARRAEIEHPS